MNQNRSLFLLLVLIMLVWSVGADTISINPTEDSQVGRTQTTSYSYAQMSVGAGTADQFNRTNTSALSLVDIYTSYGNRNMVRSLFSFNLASVPAGSTVTEVELDLYSTSGRNQFASDQDITVTNATPADPTSHVYTDYNTRVDVVFLDTNKTMTTFSIPGWNNLTLNSKAVSYTESKIGSYASFMLRIGSDINQTFNGTPANYKDYNVMVNTTDASANKPVLKITYTPSGDSIPPASVTGLGNGTTTCGGSNLTWTNPPDGDYDHLYILKNGAFYKNISTPTTFISLTGMDGLFESTAYTFSTKTVDTSGNMNATWVNKTITTPSCPTKTWPKIVITFDDGLSSANSTAFPILEYRNYNATSYVVKSLIGTAGYMSVTQLTTLYNQGWDIGNHASTHLHLTSENATMQEYYIRTGQENLTEMGFTRSAYHLAYPFGSYDAEVKASASNVGTLTARTVGLGNLTIPRASLLDLPVTFYPDHDSTLSEITGKISELGTNVTPVLLFHGIETSPTSYEWSTANFQGLTDWLYDNGYQPITISEWYVLNGGTIAPVASFSANVTSGTAPLAVGFTDSSDNAPVEWNWSFNNVAGNNTVIWWSTEQNPSITLGSGNWSFALNVSNSAGYDITPGNYWVNVSAAGAGGDTTPPASITNLVADNTTTCNAINWSWTNPGDSDFNHTMIYSEAGFLYNKSNTTNFDLWSGLAESTSYIISTHTCDTTGNCNTTWVNQSATTGVCGSAPVAAFSANVTSGSSPLSVKFTDASTNAPTNRDWYWFGNETKGSDDQDPTATFTTGTYSVRLYVSNAYGEDWENKTAYITVSDPADTTPPPGITSLTNDTSTCGSITWDWTNPGDDFHHVYLFSGNAWNQNVTTPAHSVTWSSLTGGLMYFFNATTVDTSGNVNTTGWVNSSAIASGCPPVTNFVASTTSPTVGVAMTFIDMSTNTPTNWDWYMSANETKTSDDQNPSVIFTTAGTYSIRLYSSNAFGGDWENKTNYITASNASVRSSGIFSSLVDSGAQTSIPLGTILIIAMIGAGIVGVVLTVFSGGELDGKALVIMIASIAVITFILYFVSIISGTMSTVSV